MNFLYGFVFLAIIACVSSFLSIPQNTLIRTNSKKYLFGNPNPKIDAPKKEAGGGMFGGMGNIMDQMKKAQDLAKNMEAMNKELSETLVVGSDPSGQVSVTFNGQTVPISIKISDSIVSQGAEQVSLAATLALRDAHAKSQNMMMSKMQSIYGSMGLPPPPNKPLP